MNLDTPCWSENNSLWIAHSPGSHSWQQRRVTRDKRLVFSRENKISMISKRIWDVCFLHWMSYCLSLTTCNVSWLQEIFPLDWERGLHRIHSGIQLVRQSNALLWKDKVVFSINSIPLCSRQISLMVSKLLFKTPSSAASCSPPTPTPSHNVRWRPSWYYFQSFVVSFLHPTCTPGSTFLLDRTDNH